MKALMLLMAVCGLALGQTPFSRQYLEVKPYSEEEDKAVLKLYEDLRVADVVDGLDVAGLQDVTVMDPEIKPLWRDDEKFSHRLVGLAITLRLVPPQERAQNFPSHEEFAKWESHWYGTKSPMEFVGHFKPGTVLVIDAARTRDVGFCGSNNALGWYTRGMGGIVTDGGCRDTDEIILQRIPVYLRQITRGIIPGRVLVESFNHPVNVGGVLVMPGDIIVADNDGVVVVPRGKAEVVAAAARKILEGDKKGRLRLYEKLGRKPDFTVK